MSLPPAYADYPAPAVHPAPANAGPLPPGVPAYPSAADIRAQPALMTWSELKDIPTPDARDDTGRLVRNVAVRRSYYRWTRAIRARFGAVDKYLVQHRLPLEAGVGVTAAPAVLAAETLHAAEPAATTSLAPPAPRPAAHKRQPHLAPINTAPAAAAPASPVGSAASATSAPSSPSSPSSPATPASAGYVPMPVALEQLERRLERKARARAAGSRCASKALAASPLASGVTSGFASALASPVRSPTLAAFSVSVFEPPSPASTTSPTSPLPKTAQDDAAANLVVVVDDADCAVSSDDEDDDDGADFAYLRYDAAAGLDRTTYAVLANDFPFSLPPDVYHYCVWSKVPIAHPRLVNFDAALWACIERDGLGGLTGCVPLVPLPQTGARPPTAAETAHPRSAYHTALCSSERELGALEEYALGVAVGGADARRWAGRSWCAPGGHEVARMVGALWDERGWECLWFLNNPSVPGYAHFQVFARRKTPLEIAASEEAHRLRGAGGLPGGKIGV